MLVYYNNATRRHNPEDLDYSYQENVIFWYQSATTCTLRETVISLISFLKNVL
jgi:hypothetical protein